MSVFSTLITGDPGMTAPSANPVSPMETMEDENDVSIADDIADPGRMTNIAIAMRNWLIFRFWVFISPIFQIPSSGVAQFSDVTSAILVPNACAR
jgi:hypothetical protein